MGCPKLQLLIVIMLICHVRQRLDAHRIRSRNILSYIPELAAAEAADASPPEAEAAAEADALSW